jgi:hypothetical protein
MGETAARTSSRSLPPWLPPVTGSYDPSRVASGGPPAVVIDDASHALFPEQPAAVASAVISFLDDLKLIPPT